MQQTGPRAHSHIHKPPADPAMKKTVLIAIAGGIVAIAAAVLVTQAVVRSVDVTNAGNVEVRINFKGAQVLDRHLGPGNKLSFSHDPASELVVFHPAPNENAVWTVIPVEKDTRKLEIAPMEAGTISARRDGIPVTLTTTEVPIAR